MNLDQDIPTQRDMDKLVKILLDTSQDDRARMATANKLLIASEQGIEVPLSILKVFTLYGSAPSLTQEYTICYIKQILKTITKNGSVARIADLIANINSLINSDWISYEAEKNSNVYREVITFLSRLIQSAKERDRNPAITNRSLR